eukprot:226010-Chlamydomonas_euryale.AAC.3
MDCAAALVDAAEDDKAGGGCRTSLAWRGSGDALLHAPTASRCLTARGTRLAHVALPALVRPEARTARAQRSHAVTLDGYLPSEGACV